VNLTHECRQIYTYFFAKSDKNSDSVKVIRIASIVGVDTVTELLHIRIIAIVLQFMFFYDLLCCILFPA